MRVASTRKIVGLITARNEDPGLNARNTFKNDLKHSSDDSINNQQIRVEATKHSYRNFSEDKANGDLCIKP